MQMPREMNDFVYDLVEQSQNEELDRSVRTQYSRAVRMIEGLYRNKDGNHSNS